MIGIWRHVSWIKRGAGVPCEQYILLLVQILVENWESVLGKLALNFPMLKKIVPNLGDYIPGEPHTALYDLVIPKRFKNELNTNSYLILC